MDTNITIKSVADLLKFLDEHDNPVQLIVAPEEFRKLWAVCQPSMREFSEQGPSMYFMGTVITRSDYPKSRPKVLDVRDTLKYEPVSMSAMVRSGA